MNGNTVTLEEMYNIIDFSILERLNKSLGYEFECAGGKITKVIIPERSNG